MIATVFAFHFSSLVSLALSVTLAVPEIEKSIGADQVIKSSGPRELFRERVATASITGRAEFIEMGRICEDVAPEHTGFDVHGEAGFMKHAACEHLAQYCHNSSIGEQVRVSCPVSCFICMPGHIKGNHPDGPCFDAVSTGIRFRDGPKAQCPDLINYCNHSSIGQQVQEACKLTCGLCDIHVEGPYLDAYGNCVDLQTHEEPTFTVAGALAGCADVAQFCQNHPDSYLIRHKCPLTCGVCGNHEDFTTTEAAVSEEEAIDKGGCDRRRRWGFCSTRRRRNI